VLHHHQQPRLEARAARRHARAQPDLPSNCHTRSDESLNLVSERGTGWLWRYSRQGSTEAPPRLADRDRISLGHQADRSLWHRVASQEGVPMPDPAEVMAAARAAGAAQLETYLGRTSGRTSAPPAIDIPTRGGAMSAIDLGAPPGAITSDHTGGQLDFHPHGHPQPAALRRAGDRRPGHPHRDEVHNGAPGRARGSRQGQGRRPRCDSRSPPRSPEDAGLLRWRPTCRGPTARPTAGGNGSLGTVRSRRPRLW
jgi:hypothetical protein